MSIIENSASALLAVINDMLDLQKTEAGKMELSEEAVDLASVLGGVIDTVKPPADAKGLTLGAEVSADIPRRPAR